MAINLKTFPSGTAPYTGPDWQNMINHLLGNQMIMPGRQVLTDWISVSSVVQIAQGTYFSHANNLYLTETSNESISGTIGAGFNYIKLAVSGTTLTAEWINSLTGFEYNPAYQGWYNGSGEQLLLNGIYLESSNYRRAVADNYLEPHIWIVANYGKILNNKIINTLGGNIDTGSGSITYGGRLLPQSIVDGSKTLTGAAETYIMPSGVYAIYTTDSDLYIQFKINSIWTKVSSPITPLIIFSDGENTRLFNVGGTSKTAYWIKY